MLKYELGCASAARPLGSGWASHSARAMRLGQAGVHLFPSDEVKQLTAEILFCAAATQRRSGIREDASPPPFGELSIETNADPGREPPQEGRRRCQRIEEPRLLVECRLDGAECRVEDREEAIQEIGADRVLAEDRGQ